MDLSPLSGDENLRRTVRGIVSNRLQAGGAIVLQVRTDSMAPVIRPGDRVRVLRCAPKGPRPGDVVAVPDIEGYLIHRVRDVRGRRVLLQGDANPLPDGWFEPGEIVGQVAEIRRENGWVALGRGRRLGELRTRAAALRRRILEQAGNALARGRSSRALSAGYATGLAGAARLFVRLCRRHREVDSVHLRRSAASGDWATGISDLDFTVLHECGSFEQEFDLLRRLGKDLRRWAPWVPVLTTPDVFARGDFSALAREAEYQFSEIPSWKPLLGNPLALPGRETPEKRFLDRLEEIDRAEGYLGALGLRILRGEALGYRSRAVYKKLLLDCLAQATALERGEPPARPRVSYLERAPHGLRPLVRAVLSVDPGSPAAERALFSAHLRVNAALALSLARARGDVRSPPLPPARIRRFGTWRLADSSAGPLVALSGSRTRDDPPEKLRVALREARSRGLLVLNDDLYRELQLVRASHSTRSPALARAAKSRVIFTGLRTLNQQVLTSVNSALPGRIRAAAGALVELGIFEGGHARALALRWKKRYATSGSFGPDRAVRAYSDLRAIVRELSRTVSTNRCASELSH